VVLYPAKRRINNRFQNRRRLHVTLGWSCWGNAAVLRNRPDLVAVGGGNVDKMRAEMNWLTPQVNTRFPVAGDVDEHAEHHGHHGGMMMPEMAMDLTQFDGVLSAARNAGLMPASWRSARRKRRAPGR
jgi:hypothetical protein